MRMSFNFIARKFNQHGKKRKYEQSYPDTEFECKVIFAPNNLVKIVQSLLTNAKNNKVEVDEVAQRQEFHHFYTKKNIHRALIFSRGSKEVWLKEKSNGSIAYSPQCGIPILVRKEKKLKPADVIYNKLFLETLRWDYVGSFQKESVDISFLFKGFLYTITVAESSTGWSRFAQIEIEYDGYLSHAKRPTKQTIISLFDEIARLLLPRSMMCFTTETKLQWLKLNSNHLSKSK